MSVVMPNFNHGHLIEQALAAIARQTMLPFEVVVVDDGSTDDSVPRVQSLTASMPWLRIHRHPENRGVNAACNSGLELVSGDFVLFSAADDCLSPEMVERACAAAAAHSRTGIVFSDHAEMSADGATTRLIPLDLPGVRRHFSGGEFVRLMQQLLHPAQCLFNVELLQVHGFRLDSGGTATVAVQPLRSNMGPLTPGAVSIVASCRIRRTAGLSSSNRCTRGGGGDQQPAGTLDERLVSAGDWLNIPCAGRRPVVGLEPSELWPVLRSRSPWTKVAPSASLRRRIGSSGPVSPRTVMERSTHGSSAPGDRARMLGARLDWLIATLLQVRSGLLSLSTLMPQSVELPDRSAFAGASWKSAPDGSRRPIARRGLDVAAIEIADPNYAAHRSSQSRTTTAGLSNAGRQRRCCVSSTCRARSSMHREFIAGAGGHCIHVLPTHTWRLWTTLTSHWRDLVFPSSVPKPCRGRYRAAWNGGDWWEVVDRRDIPSVLARRHGERGMLSRSCGCSIRGGDGTSRPRFCRRLRADGAVLPAKCCWASG
jgi:hypothetical protein